MSNVLDIKKSHLAKKKKSWTQGGSIEPLISDEVLGLKVY